MTDLNLWEIENDKQQFIDAMNDHFHLKPHLRACLEIAPLFFTAEKYIGVAGIKASATGEFNWRTFAKRIWFMFDALGGSSAWVSRKGNILSCGWGDHVGLCKWMILRPDYEFEKTWVKISTAPGHKAKILNQGLTKPMTPKQEKAVYQFISDIETHHNEL